MGKGNNKHLNWTIGLLSDASLGFCWWSYLLMMADHTFFFPLFDMGVSGYEFPLIFLLIGLAMLHTFEFGRNLSRKYAPIFGMIATLGYISVVSSAAFKIVWSCVGGIASFLAFAGIASSPIEERRSRCAYGHLLGLAILSLVKSWGWSLLPHNYSPLYVIPIIVWVLLSCIFLLYESKGHKSLETPFEPKANSFLVTLMSGAHLACSVYLLNTFSTSLNVIPRWTSLPVYPFQIFPFLALLVGIFFANSPLVGKWWWCLLAVVGGTLVRNVDGVPGLVGGCLVVVFLVSSYHHAIHNASITSASSFLFGWLLWFVAMVGLIWSVAYNFVPGGWVMRERIGLLLIVWLGAICVGNLYGPFSQSLSQFKQKYFWKMVLVFFLVALLIGVPVAYQRVKNRGEAPPPRQNTGGGIFSSMVWTVHFGYDNNGGSNFDGAADLIRGAGTPDVIGLLETDMARPFMGNRDMIEYLEETFHYYYSDYGPATKTSSWGCSLLSRYPILSSRPINLPSPDGELACLVDVTIKIEGKEVDYLVTHFGVWETPLDRKLQAIAIADMIENEKKDKDVIFMGYITAPPYTHENYKKVLSTGLIDSLPKGTDLARRWYATDRWCQYILYKGVEIVDFARKSVGHISDTEWQKGIFRLPKNK